MKTTNPPTSQPSNNPGQAIADLINDMRDLTSTLDSFSLSFTLAWERHISHFQCQHSPTATTTQAERTAP
jgi:hypothetical protein